MLVDEGEAIIPHHLRLANGWHPISSVNEPPPGHSANCVFVCWYKTTQLIPAWRISRLSLGSQQATAVRVLDCR
jgi:hypothetical protein